jgi:hypothetical protein
MKPRDFTDFHQMTQSVILSVAKNLEILRSLRSLRMTEGPVILLCQSRVNLVVNFGFRAFVVNNPVNPFNRRFWVYSCLFVVK